MKYCIVLILTSSLSVGAAEVSDLLAIEKSWDARGAQAVSRLEELQTELKSLPEIEKKGNEGRIITNEILLECAFAQQAAKPDLLRKKTPDGLACHLLLNGGVSGSFDIAYFYDLQGKLVETIVESLPRDWSVNCSPEKNDAIVVSTDTGQLYVFNTGNPFACESLATPAAGYTNANTQWTRFTKLFDGVPISIWMPGELADSSLAPAAITFSKTLPANVALLGMFLGNDPSYSGNVAGIRQDPGKVLSLEYFKYFKEYSRSHFEEMAKSPQVKAQLAAVEQAASTTMSEQFLTKISMETGQMLILGIFDESPRHFSELTLSRQTIAVGSETTNDLIVGSLSFCYLNGKVININYYKKFDGKNSYEAVKNLAREALKRDLLSNQ